MTDCREESKASTLAADSWVTGGEEGGKVRLPAACALQITGWILGWAFSGAVGEREEESRVAASAWMKYALLATADLSKERSVSIPKMKRRRNAVGEKVESCTRQLRHAVMRDSLKTGTK